MTRTTLPQDHRRRIAAQPRGKRPGICANPPHCDDRGRHPDHQRHPEQWRRGLSVPRLSAFDGLIDWDFTHPKQIAGLTPGLATAWKIDPADHTRWIFTLAPGGQVHRRHPRSPPTRSIWNLQRLYDEKSPQFDPAASAIVRSFVNMLAHWQKIDDRHGRDLHQIAVQLLPVHGPQYPDRQPDRVGEIGQAAGPNSPSTRPAPGRSRSPRSCPASSPS